MDPILTDVALSPFAFTGRIANFAAKKRIMSGEGGLNDIMRPRGRRDAKSRVFLPHAPPSNGSFEKAIFVSNRQRPSGDDPPSKQTVNCAHGAEHPHIVMKNDAAV